MVMIGLWDHLLVMIGSRLICKESKRFRIFLHVPIYNVQLVQYLRPLSFKAQKAYDRSVFTVVLWEEQCDVANISELGTPASISR